MRLSIRLSACAFLLGLLLIAADHAAAATGLHAKPPRSQPLPLAVVRALVDRYAAKYGIPLQLARKLVAMESGWRQNAVSRKGARGIMQLRPRTARGLRVNIYNTEQNIEGGMRYLRQQYERFGRWDLALAAYHSGPAKVVKYRGVPPKSRRYVRLILGNAKYPPPGQQKVAPEPAASHPAKGPVPAKPPEPLAWESRQTVMRTGEARIATMEILRHGRVSGRIVEILVGDGERSIRITREYSLTDGVWTLDREVVEEEDS